MHWRAGANNYCEVRLCRENIVPLRPKSERQMTEFKEMGLGQELLRAIDEQGYEHPMPVQEQVIPWLLGQEEKDLVALAQTGTGKTAAYGHFGRTDEAFAWEKADPAALAELKAMVAAAK